MKMRGIISRILHSVIPAYRESFLAPFKEGERFRIPKHRAQASRNDRLCGSVNGVMILFLLFTFYLSLFTSTYAAEKWPGVDEAVVEKIAKEHGREARESLINTDQGDLLLFAFLLAGAAGGFAAGYYWRTLFARKTKDRE